MKLIGSLEGILAICNASIAGWLFGLGGVEVVADTIQSSFGQFVSPDTAIAMPFLMPLPFLLPVGFLGLITIAVFSPSRNIAGKSC